MLGEPLVARFARKLPFILRLQQKLFLTDISLLNTTTKEQEAIVATACKKIETDCGYLVSPELLTVLCHIPPSEFVSFFQTLYAQLKAYKGAVPLKPFYVNFPKQVMQASEVELYGVCQASIPFFD